MKGPEIIKFKVRLTLDNMKRSKAPGPNRIEILSALDD